MARTEQIDFGILPVRWLTCLRCEFRPGVRRLSCRAIFIFFVAFLNFALTDASWWGTCTGIFLL